MAYFLQHAVLRRQTDIMQYVQDDNHIRFAEFYFAHVTGSKCRGIAQRLLRAFHVARHDLDAMNGKRCRGYGPMRRPPAGALHCLS